MITAPRAQLGALVATLSLAMLTGCQSTQSRSAELESEGATMLVSESGLKIEEPNKDVKVVSTQLLSDQYGTAVVVRLRNSSARNLVDVPILLRVFDPKGKEIYTNEIPGIEQALAAVPFIPAQGEVDWVNDQVLAAGKPKTVKVEIGAGDQSYSGPMPRISVTEPKIEGDPVSGIEASGKISNDTGEDQDRIVLYAVAREDGRVVAAGRGAIEHMKASAKPQGYDIFFIGDPKGAEVEVSDYPTLPGFTAE